MLFLGPNAAIVLKSKWNLLMWTILTNKNAGCGTVVDGMSIETAFWGRNTSWEIESWPWNGFPKTVLPQHWEIFGFDANCDTNSNILLLWLFNNFVNLNLKFQWELFLGIRSKHIGELRLKFHQTQMIVICECLKWWQIQFHIFGYHEEFQVRPLMGGTPRKENTALESRFPTHCILFNLTFNFNL